MTAGEKDPQFEALLDYIKRNRGFDFTGYKRASLMRRVRKRMHTVHMENFESYQDYLEVHPEEFAPLFNTILINVTAFFRDADAWDYLAQEIIPRIIDDKRGDRTDDGKPDNPIRVWSAGCASGQEAYAIAMLLAEVLGPEAFNQRVKIYATDADEEALAQARVGAYSEKELEEVPHELLQKYFEPATGGYVFRGSLRRAIIFGRHDLLQDAPISRLDLLVCRNTLMYFNAETQSRILARFHFALNQTGYLFLGRAEMLLTHANLFTPVELKHRIFTKVSRVDLHDRMLILSQGRDEDAGNHQSRVMRLRETAFDAAPIAQIAVDAKGNLMLANALARTYFGLGLTDLPRPLQDLEMFYRPLDLRSSIEQAYLERRTIIVNDVPKYLPDGTTQYLDVRIIPLQDPDTELFGAGITFTDVSIAHRLKEDLLRANEELETANEELETTNEELQSTNEELETTNEELETTNEELQSTNEELETINTELRLRTAELNEINAYTESMLASLRAGVVVLDQRFCITTWNSRAEDLWGVRGDEVRGQSLLSLDIGLPVEPLKQPIRDCLAGAIDGKELLLEATNRRGKPVKCRVACAPLLNARNEREGVILLMERADGEKADGEKADGEPDRA